MRKKLPLIAGFLLLALLFLSGYLTGSRQTSHTPAEVLQTQPSRRAPQLTLNRQTVAPGAENGTSGLSRRALNSILIRCAHMTPEQWKKELEEHEDDWMLSCILLQTWAQKAPDQALEWAKSRNDTTYYYHCPTIFQSWAENQPEAAFAYFIEHRDELPQSKDILKAIAREIGSQAPDRVMNWLAGLGKEERKEALPALLSGIADKHPEQLAKHVARLTPEELKDNPLCQTLASEWAAADWDTAAQWINSLPEPQQKQARNAALGKLGTLDPAKAAQEFQKLDVKAQQSAADAIADALGRQSPVEAMKWLTSHTQEDIAAKSCDTLLQHTLILDPAVEKHIVQMPEGIVRDEALSTLIQYTFANTSGSFTTHADRLNLTGLIKDKQKRESITSSMLNSWYRYDPEKAKSWVETSDQPEAVKKSRIKAMEKYKKRFDDMYNNRD